MQSNVSSHVFHTSAHVKVQMLAEVTCLYAKLAAITQAPALRHSPLFVLNQRWSCPLLSHFNSVYFAFNIASNKDP